MDYLSILKDFSLLADRCEISRRLLETIRNAFLETKISDDKRLTAFCAGSLAREEIGSKSDLDIFVVTSEDCLPRLYEIEIYATLIEINHQLKFPDFSNDGEFLKIYSLNEMMTFTGSPRDDHENFFTARMLYLLESKALSNTAAYDWFLKDIIRHYFRDATDHEEFLPVFLVNDILRYWRTLCLNYEVIRNDVERPWRKKNVNLKFSRMLTVFGTIVPVVAKPITDSDSLFELCQLTPMQRLAYGLEQLGEGRFDGGFNMLLEDYEQFLAWKEDDDIESKMTDPNVKNSADETAKRVANFLYEILTSENIALDLKKYLVI